MVTKFEVGLVYTMRSICDYDCVWAYRVIKRTDKTVTLRGKDGKEKSCRVKVWNNTECCKPLGSYSMAPTLCAK